MAEPGPAPPPWRRAAHFVLVAAFLTALWLAASSQAGAIGTQEDPGGIDPVAPETTSTLPTGGEVGNIVPRPNSGQVPETPGDPGGSQQVALFFVLCVVLAGIGAFVWWRSRVARSRREAEGRDPVRVATEAGADVRKPRPPGIVD